MQKRAHIAGVMFAVIFGFSFMFSKTALAHVTPMGLMAYRFMTAFLAFEMLRLLRVVRIRFEKRYVKSIFLVVILQPIAYFLFETFGLAKTTSSEAGMMIALIPIFATIFGAAILKEKPNMIQVFFIVLSVSGIIFIQWSKRAELSFEAVGFLLLFGAVLSAALFNIASRQASRTIKPYELTYFMMLVGAVVFNALYLMQLVMESRVTDYVMVLAQPALILPILYLGMMASIGGFFLVNFTLSRLEAHVMSIYANLATIVAITAGAVLLGEMLFYYHYVGSAMIIIGVYGTVSNNRRRSQRAGLAQELHPES